MNRGDLFTNALNVSGIRPKELADALGVKPNDVSNWKKRGVPHKFVIPVAEVLRVDPADISPIHRLLPERDQGDPLLKQKLALDNVVGEQASHYQPLGGITEVPEIDVLASLGPGNVFSSADIRRNWQIEENLLILAGILPKNARLIQCQGDSMEPLICDGDMVLVDLDLKDGGPGLYVFDSGRGLQIKRIQTNVLEGTVTVKSENPKYPPTTYTAEEAAEEIKPFGRVVKKYWSNLK